jgi:hypothetical protein
MNRFRSRSTPLLSTGGQAFQPPSRLGALIPGVAGALALLLALALVVRAFTIGVSFSSFAMLLVALVLIGASGIALYWTWCCLALRYTLDHGVLSITWGLTRHDVPVSVFERVVRGRASARLTVDGIDLPGCHVGTAELPRIGRVQVISLHRRPSELLFLTGREATYAVSVGDASGFIRALQAQMEQPAALDAPRVVSAPVLRVLAWRDAPVMSALGSAVVLAIIATGIIFGRYAGFADEIAMTFPEDGRVGPRTALLGIPLAAWLLLIANGAAGVRLSVERRTAAFTLLYGLTFLEALLVIAAATAV